MWRKLFKVFGAKVVETTDYAFGVCGDKRYRFARTVDGKMYCSGILGGNEILLNDDGTCSGLSYVNSWKLI